MPLYLDVHPDLDDLTAQAVIEAHRKDLEAQGKQELVVLSLSR